MADIEYLRILEGSILCCDIKTEEVIVILPEEGAVYMSAELLVSAPDSISLKDLYFSYSIDIKDSIKIFDCKMIGRNETDIYFISDKKVFCSKPAIINLRDPSSFCSQNKMK